MKKRRESSQKSQRSNIIFRKYPTPVERFDTNETYFPHQNSIFLHNKGFMDKLRIRRAYLKAGSDEIGGFERVEEYFSKYLNDQKDRFANKAVGCNTINLQKNKKRKRKKTNGSNPNQKKNKFSGVNENNSNGDRTGVYNNNKKSKIIGGGGSIRKSSFQKQKRSKNKKTSRVTFKNFSSQKPKNKNKNGGIGVTIKKKTSSSLGGENMKKQKKMKSKDEVYRNSSSDVTDSFVTGDSDSISSNNLTLSSLKKKQVVLSGERDYSPDQEKFSEISKGDTVSMGEGDLKKKKNIEISKLIKSDENDASGAWVDAKFISMNDFQKKKNIEKNIGMTGNGVEKLLVHLPKEEELNSFSSSGMSEFNSEGEVDLDRLYNKVLSKHEIFENRRSSAKKDENIGEKSNVIMDKYKEQFQKTKSGLYASVIMNEK